MSTLSTCTLTARKGRQMATYHVLNSGPLEEQPYPLSHLASSSVYFLMRSRKNVNFGGWKSVEILEELEEEKPEFEIRI